MKQRVRSFSLAFFPLLIICSVLLTVYYNSRIESENEQLRQAESHVVSLQKAEIEDDLMIVIDDLLLLAAHTNNTDIWKSNRANSDRTRDILKKEYRAFSIGKYRIYDQLRYIDSTGMELVRINFNNGKPQIVPDNLLQKKNHRYYYKDVRSLNIGEVYISVLDLNMEHGEIETPFRPMIRFGTPIYYNNSFQGMVIINYLASNLISSFRQIGEASIGDPIFLNSKGEWIVSPDPNQNWSFLFSHKTAKSFAELFPEEWQQIRSGISGQFQHEEGLYTYNTVYPVPGTFQDDAYIVKPAENVWKLVSFVSDEALQSAVMPVKIEIYRISAIALILISLVSAIFTQLRIKRKSFEKALREANENLEKKVHERTLELVIAKEKAEESDKLKTSFLQNISHEIRTPMNGILGFTELLKDSENLSAEERRNYIDTIDRCGKRMLNTISNILDISLIESGQMKVSMSKVNMQHLLQTLVLQYKPRLDAKGLMLKTECNLSKEQSLLLTDNEKLYSILTNLIDNAIKFTNQGRIEIGCCEKEQFLEFYIKDTGVGIPRKQRESVFDRFIQSDISLSRGYEGSGLGLSITKAYVEMLGGTIRVKTRRGIGTTFTFTLPYNKVDISSQVVGQKSSLETRIEGLKIIVADDDEISNFLIKEYLRDTAEEIKVVKNGVSAIRMARENPDFKLVLMDIKMPLMDGLEATRRIKIARPEVIVIAQTAYAYEDDKKRALEVGCDAYIAKPIKKEELLKVVKAELKKKASYSG